MVRQYRFGEQLMIRNWKVFNAIAWSAIDDSSSWFILPSRKRLGPSLVCQAKFAVCPHYLIFWTNDQAALMSIPKHRVNIVKFFLPFSARSWAKFQSPIITCCILEPLQAVRGRRELAHFAYYFASHLYSNRGGDIAQATEGLAENKPKLIWAFRRARNQQLIYGISDPS